MSQLSYKKTNRLVKRWEYKNLYKNFSRSRGENLVVDYSLERGKTPRLGITVSKRFGNACKRNKFKRLVREVFRNHLTKLPSPLVLNVKPSCEASKICFDKIQNELQNILLTQIGKKE